MTDKEKDEIAEIVHKGKAQIADAIEAATDGHKERPFGWFCDGRFWGELTSDEFSQSRKYSFYGWIAAALEGLDIDIATEIFGGDVTRFTEIIEQSISNHVIRKFNFLKQLRSGENAKANPKVARMARYFQPKMDANAIISALKLYALAA